MREPRGNLVEIEFIIEPHSGDSWRQSGRSRRGLGSFCGSLRPFPGRRAAKNRAGSACSDRWKLWCSAVVRGISRARSRRMSFGILRDFPHLSVPIRVARNKSHIVEIFQKVSDGQSAPCVFMCSVLSIFVVLPEGLMLYFRNGGPGGQVVCLGRFEGRGGRKGPF